MHTDGTVQGDGVTPVYLERHDGFDDWYEGAHARVLSTVALAFGSMDLASEATDEAFARALDKWAHVRGMASPTGWVVTVALNVARRRVRRQAFESHLLRRRTAHAAELPAAATGVFELTRALPEQQRTIVLLRYVADLPQATIASLLGVSRSTVSTALTSAHRTLRTLFDEDDNPPTMEGDRRD